MYTNKLMHNKFCVIDGAIVINGSYNWTNNASNNHENIQITFDDKNLTYKYIQEFKKIQNQAISINDHFKSNDKKYLEYIAKEKKPIKYPLFLKINFYKFIIITEKLQKIGDKYVYVFVNNFDDFEYFQIFLFNNQIRNVNFKYENFKLPMFENIYETQKPNYHTEFNTKYFDFSDLNENEHFEKNNYLKLDDKSYGKVKRETVEKLYHILFTYKDKFPIGITSIEELKLFVKSLYNKLDYKSYFTISEEIILNKLYFRLPISFNNYYEVNYQNESNERLIFCYLNNDECVVSSKTNRSNEFYIINNKAEIISEKLLFNSYNLYKEDNLLKKYRHNIYSIRENYIIYYERNQIKDYYNKNTTRTLYGILDKKGEILVPAIFDYIVWEDTSKIILEILPFAILEYENLHTPVTLNKEKYIINHEPDRVLKFTYSHSENELKQIKFSKIKSDIYLFESAGKYANFYQEIIFITQNTLEILEVKNYFINSNLMNLDKSKMHTIINSKVQEIREIQKKSQTNKNCYIATLVYEDINHPKVEILRNFRDEILLKYTLGRAFVKAYYHFSPQIVSYLHHKKKINSAIKKLLNKFINLIEK